MNPPLRHLVIDARTLRPGATGVGHHVAGLLAGLAAEVAHGAPWRVTALVLPNGGTGLPDPPINLVSVPADPEDHPAADGWLHRGLPRLVEELGGDVLVSPAFLAPVGRRRFVRLAGIPDTLAWDDPGTVPQPFRTYLKVAARLGAAGADGLFTLSPPVAQRLRSLGFRGTPLRVLPPAVDPALFHPGKGDDRTLPDGSAPRGPVILFTGAFEPRKNHDVLLEALRQPPLAVHGVELVLLDREAPERVAALGHRTRGLAVRGVAPQGMADVAAWTRAADAVAFPSRSEGFGIPALEAMACGVPLVASDIAVMRWLTAGGRCAALVPPRDAAAWACGLAGALARPLAPEWQDRVAHGLRRARAFRWRRTARALLAMADEAMARRRG